MNGNKSITIIAPAKINLYLHIHQKLQSGFHSLESFIVFINLYDKIHIIPSSTSNLEITGFSCGPVEENLVIKIINYIKKQFNINLNFTIKLEKNIPVGAGLGGGSADAAAILKALNIFCNLELSNNDLTNIALKFGADIPSCIYSTSGIMEAIGNKFTPLPLNFKLHILLISNLIPLFTKDVYNILTPSHYYQGLKINTTHTQNYNNFLKYIVKQKNCLTTAATKLNQEILHILNLLNSTNPVVARMTGSGSCCFAIYSSANDLNSAYNKINSMSLNYFVKKVNNL